MPPSPYITDILSLLLNSDEDGLSVKGQIDCVEEQRRDHTGVGLFVHFRVKPGTEETLEKHLAQKPNLVLDGVNITSPELLEHAYAIAFFKDGVLDNLEILSVDGPYPKEDPEHYTLVQNWVGSPELKIER